LLLGFVGCLTAEGCDPGIDPLPACGDVQETELAPEEDPEAYARAAAFAPRASFTPEDAFDADVPLDVPLDMSVAEVLAVSRLDGTACAYGEDPGFEADVLVTISAESGALHLELPAHVEWTDRSGAFALAAGDYAWSGSASRRRATSRRPCWRGSPETPATGPRSRSAPM
jgi:hypothetical protein